jgi:hypothetical protein
LVPSLRSSRLLGGGCHLRRIGTIPSHAAEFPALALRFLREANPACLISPAQTLSRPSFAGSGLRKLASRFRLVPIEDSANFTHIQQLAWNRPSPNATANS